jgi:hypothetical protein
VKVQIFENSITEDSSSSSGEWHLLHANLSIFHSVI